MRKHLLVGAALAAILGAPSAYAGDSGAVTASPPSYTDGKQGELSLDTNGNLRAVSTPGATTTFRVSDTPTVQNAAYVSGNCVGGFRSVTLTANVGVGGLLQSVKVTSLGGGTEGVTLYVFDSNPTGSTCTDKSTFTLASTDVDKIIGAPTALSLSAATGATATFGLSGSIATPFVEGGSTGSGVATVYYALVSGGSFTPATTSDLHVSIGVVMDRP